MWVRVPLACHLPGLCLLCVCARAGDADVSKSLYETSFSPERRSLGSPSRCLFVRAVTLWRPGPLPARHLHVLWLTHASTGMCKGRALFGHLLQQSYHEAIHNSSLNRRQAILGHPC